MGKYQVGDELRIKQVEDIICHSGISFVRAMDELCGRDFTVKEIFTTPAPYGTVAAYLSYEETEKINYIGGSRGYWIITDDMLEPRETEASIEISTDEFLKMLKE